MARPSDQTYQVIPELDAAIIDCLPRVGDRVGFKPSARQVKAIRQVLSEVDPTVTGASVGGRMNVLHHIGYVKSVVVQPVGNGAGWQKTPEGEQFVERVKKGEVS